MTAKAAEAASFFETAVFGFQLLLLG